MVICEISPLTVGVMLLDDRVKTVAVVTFNENKCFSKCTQAYITADTKTQLINN